MEKKKQPRRNTTPRKGGRVQGRKGIGSSSAKVDPEIMDAYVMERMRANLKRRGLVLYEDGSVGPDPNISDEYIEWRKTI